MNFTSTASATINMRDSTNSHIHTTLVANAATGPTGSTGSTGATGPQGIPSSYTGALDGNTGTVNVNTSATILTTTSITTTYTGRIWSIATFNAETTSNQSNTLSIYMTIGSETSPTYTHVLKNSLTSNISHQYRTLSLPPGTYTITLYGLGDTTVFRVISMQIFSMSSLT